jgi:hypothetical protein
VADAVLADDAVEIPARAEDGEPVVGRAWSSPQVRTTRPARRYTLANAQMRAVCAATHGSSAATMRSESTIIAARAAEVRATRRSSSTRRKTRGR